MSTDAPPAAVSTAARQRQAVRRGGYALVSSSMLSSLAGVAYWWVAARAWPSDRVGQAAALISSMALVAELASLGMATGLVRHLPTAGAGARALIVRAYATAIALAAVLGIACLLLLDRVVADLPHADRALGTWFVLGTCVWVVFVMQDGVLVGLGRATVVPVENALFGIVRVALVATVAATTARTTPSLYLTWIVPSAVGVAIVTALVLRRWAVADGPVPRAGTYRSTVRFSVVNHVAAMLQRVWPMAMPVAVLSVLGAEAGSHAFIAWSSAYALWLVSSGTGQALLAEGSRTPTLLHRLTGTALDQTLRLTVLGAAITVVVAPWYLSLFGRDYADGGSTLLRLLAVAAVPNAVTALYLSTQRARSALRSVLVVQAALGLPTLALAVPIMRWHGLNGLGVLWLANQSVVAAIVLVRHRWDLWIPSLTPRTLDALGRIGRLRARRADRADLSPSAGSTVVTVLAPEPVGVVTKRAVGAAGVERLRREAAHLRAVGSTDGLRDLRSIVPEVLSLSLDDERAELRITALPGVQADPRQPASLDRIAELAGTLHGATSRTAIVGDDEISRWVRDRVDVVEGAVRRVAPDRLDALARIGEAMATELRGADIRVGAIHGDLSPANVLVDAGTGRVTGIVDWELAGFGEPIALDVVQLLLAFPVARKEAELGQLVAELLEFGWPDDARAVLHRHAPCDGAAPDSPAVLLLTWLRHVSANIVKNPGYGCHRVWVLRNLLPVLDVGGARG